MPAGPALTQLIPIQEIAPGAISAIRNQVITNLLRQVSRELTLPEEQLVVRDVRPFNDLQLYSTGTTDSTSDRWGYAATGTTLGYVAINAGTKTMSDQRYVALYGVRDRSNWVASGSATLAVARTIAKPVVSFVKINVGGADRVQWDLTSMYAYSEALAAFTPTAVIIPQNVTYVVSFYRPGSLEVGTTTGPVTDEISWLQLVGIVVEPRGKLISP